VERGSQKSGEIITGESGLGKKRGQKRVNTGENVGKMAGCLGGVDREVEGCIIWVRKKGPAQTRIRPIGQAVCVTRVSKKQKKKHVWD